jgi:hypothetical protein
MRILGTLFVALVLAGALAAQKKYSGPRPAKPDVPYLLHATNLVETEVNEAKEEDRKDKDWKAYVVSPAASPARTPLAEPIFLLTAEKLVPDKLGLYKVEPKNGKREVLFPTNAKKQKDRPRPYRLSITRLEPNLFRLEVNHGPGLDIGEYCLTPEETSNQVFCFGVY